MRKLVQRLLICCLAADISVQAQTVWTYQPTNAFPSLVFSNPVCITSPPGETNRLFILEKHGRIVVITNLMNPTRTIFMDISGRVTPTSLGGESADVSGEQGLLGMAFHPDYANNRFFYLFYCGQATNNTSGLHEIVSRFQTTSTNANAGDPNSEKQLIVQYDRASNHNGGDLHFGPEGYLYVSLGDEGNQDNTFHNAQHIDLNFFSGILRLDVDKKPGSLVPNPSPTQSATTNYAVPPDNPFVGATSFDNLPVNSSQLRTEFWSVGFRNPWRFSFDAATGILYCGDVGQDQFEEVDIVTKGGNYGWSTFEGISSPPSGVSTNAQPIPQNPIFPICTYAHGSGTNQGNAVIGGVVYHGNKLPELNGSYVFADEVSGNVWRLNYNGISATANTLLFTNKDISCFGIDPSSGDVLYAKLNNGNNSIIQRIISTNSVPSINSVKLSGTNFIVSGTNGPHNGNYFILVSTNLTTPVTSWARASTNPFDASGNFIFTNPINSSYPALFYLLQLQ